MDQSTPDTTFEEDESKIDRGISSVASQPKGRIAFMVILLGVALIAIVVVVISGLEKDAPKSKVEPLETVFKSPPSSGAPYIEPDPPTPPSEEKLVAAEKTEPVDHLAMQRELSMQQEALRIAREQQKRMDERLRSPQVIFDKGDNIATLQDGSDAGTMQDAGTASLVGSDDPNQVFANAHANIGIDVAKATTMQNPGTMIPQGTMIAGILETAIQSDLPGMLRAIVSEDVHSFDGSQLLIPKGSRLIGRYKSGLVRGQARVFIIWNRLLRNDGVSINLGSFGTDDLGRSGLDGDLDTHFLERFGSSILLSMIDTGLKIGTNSLENRNSATVAIESGNDFSSAAEVALENSVAIPPTIHVDQGKRIKVFVGKDLDFSSVSTRTSQR